jgi:hypothetical protein
MSPPSQRPWRRALAALAAVAVLGGHLLALHHVASRIALPAALGVLIIALVVVTHSGVLGILHERFRR